MKNRKWFSHMIKICLFAFIILLLFALILFGYRLVVQQHIHQKSAEIIKNGGISELKEIVVNGEAR